MKRFDAIVIGTGQAGPLLARRHAAAGKQVAIVERHLFGGTCVNTGCIPTKTLVASAYVAHMARRAADFGVTIAGSVSMNMPAVKARKDAISAQSRTSLEDSLRKLHNCTVFNGHARFESVHDISVGGETITAKHIFINVGERATVPRIPGIDDTGYLTNSSMMDVDFVPPHLLILGGSYIGLEFGQMYRRFGSQVTIFQRGPRLIPKEDEDVSRAVQEIVESEGIQVRLNADCIRFSREGADLTAHLQCSDGQPAVTGTHLLVAVGRQPNTADLGLDRAGVATDGRGYIVVDDQLRTSVPGIWAVGDCNGRGGFTHTSWNDAEIVAANLFDADANERRVSDRIPAYALFIDPPLGRAGMSEKAVRESGRKALIGKRDMTKVARSIEKGESKGFMKILVDAETHQILGAAILGVGGDEVIHSILDVMYAKQPYTLIQRAMHIHPTVSELIPTMLGELQPLES